MQNPLNRCLQPFHYHQTHHLHYYQDNSENQTGMYCQQIENQPPDLYMESHPDTRTRQHLHHSRTHYAKS